MVLEVVPDAGQVGDRADAQVAQLAAAGPMPDSRSSCGEPTAPAHTITSPAVCAWAGAPSRR